jgi:hypothetical protein
VVTTDSQHPLEVYLNLASRMKLTGVNQFWVADVTYGNFPAGNSLQVKKWIKFETDSQECLLSATPCRGQLHAIPEEQRRAVESVERLVFGPKWTQVAELNQSTSGSVN